MKRIYTHVNVDLDAASSVALYMLQNPGEYELVFVSADFNGIGMKDRDVALDINAGGRGIKGEKSAFSAILKNMPNNINNAFKQLADYIDFIDTGGKSTVVENQCSLLIAFHGIKRALQNDKLVVTNWYNVINGIWLSYKDTEKAKKIATKVQTDEEQRIAILVGNAPLQTQSILFDRGFEFIIYENGNNMGIRRGPKSKINLGTLLKEELPHWFHHPSGFLSCWGSAKAPKERPNNESLDFIIDLLIGKLGG